MASTTLAVLTRAAIALRSHKLRDVARALGCSTRAVTSWRASSKLPTERHRAALELAPFNIPQSDWYLLSAQPSAPVAAPRTPLSKQLEQCQAALSRPDLAPSARFELERLRLAIESGILESTRNAKFSRSGQSRSELTDTDSQLN
jgi:hypothetical protein